MPPTFLTWLVSAPVRLWLMVLLALLAMLVALLGGVVSVYGPWTDKTEETRAAGVLYLAGCFAVIAGIGQVSLAMVRFKAKTVLGEVTIEDEHDDHPPTVEVTTKVS